MRSAAGRRKIPVPGMQIIFRPGYGQFVCCWWRHGFDVCPDGCAEGADHWLGRLDLVFFRMDDRRAGHLGGGFAVSICGAMDTVCRYRFDRIWVGVIGFHG